MPSNCGTDKSVKWMFHPKVYLTEPRLYKTAGSKGNIISGKQTVKGTEDKASFNSEIQRS